MSESLGRLSMQTDAAKAVSDADLVIEAIVENLETKQRLFASLDRAAPRFLVKFAVCCNCIVEGRHRWFGPEIEAKI